MKARRWTGAGADAEIAEARCRRTASCRSRRRWWGCGSRRQPGPPASSGVTAHSGRVGLASELTSRRASTTDVMLAGNWKTSRMVVHYWAGATAERGSCGAVPLGNEESGMSSQAQWRAPVVVPYCPVSFAPAPSRSSKYGDPGLAVHHASPA